MESVANMSTIRDVWLPANSIIRAARKIINTELRPLGLSSAEGNILLHMLVRGEKVSQEQLVEQLDISKAAISRAVDSLGAKGYVIRQRDPEDKRVYQLFLTDKAGQVARTIEQIYNHIYRVARQDISTVEFDELIDLLTRISKNFIHEQDKGEHIDAA